MPASRVNPLEHRRLELIRGLGEGGYGVVYEAYDHVLAMRVALKQLLRVGPDALLRFKREFRALADLHHPNVVRLYELFESEGSWFFTMELIEGTDFCSYVRDTADLAGFDEARLRSGLVDLARGLSAMHQAGLVHRDIKPANVRVTRDGRVVLLDFGLVLQERSSREDSQILGTLDYMAPEQSAPALVAPAADWYAVGVIMYECLTGQLPFYGEGLEVLLEKQRAMPIRPRERMPLVPEDLDELCMRLLTTDPRARADGQQVLAVLRGRKDSAPPPPLGGLFGDPLVQIEGRDRELSELFSAFDSARSGEPTVAILEGDSGLGKSTLMHHFAVRIEASVPNVLILTSHCYERETVPYKALDGIIDALSLHLVSARRHALPAEASALARAFPVLERVPAISARSLRPPPDPAAQRRQILEAFSAVMRSLCSVTPVVLCIDDLQWADADSLSLLHAMLTAEGGPGVLLVGTARPLERVDAESTSVLKQLISLPSSRRIALRGITPEASRTLVARALLGRASPEQIESIVAESEGHPMFLAELARDALESERSKDERVTLDQAIVRRVARASFVARSIVELLAVAGAPLSKVVLREALSIPGEELIEGLSELTSESLVHTSARSDLECYHDRVRESLVSGLDPQTRAAYHGRLARALEEHLPEAGGRIAAHWLGSGEPKRAIPWLERAAARSEETLAFGRAAELYAQLHELREHADPPRVQSWHLARGNALANAGRSVEAGHEYVAALEGASHPQSLELKQRAAQAFLQGGEVKPGLELMRSLFRDVSLGFADTTNSALLRIAWHRTCLGLSRVDVPPVPAERVSRAQRDQLELLFDLAPALGWVDMMRGVELQNRHLRLALKVRDARHLALALAYEAAFVGASTVDAAKAASRAARARELAASIDDPFVHAVVFGCEGLVAFFRLRLGEATSALSEAERLYREHCLGASWHLGVVRTNLLTTFLLAGDCANHLHYATLWMRDAQDRGDMLAYTSLLVLGGGFHPRMLAEGAEAAEAELDEHMARWPEKPFSTQHLGRIIAKANLKRTRVGAEAHHYLESRWHELERSIIGRSNFTQGAMLPIRAQCAIAAAVVADGEERRRLLTHAERQLKPLSRLRLPGARVRATLLAAQFDALHGRVEQGITKLRALLASEEGNVLALEHAATEYLLGVLVGGDEGRALRERALDSGRERGFPDPYSPILITVPAITALE